MLGILNAGCRRPPHASPFGPRRDCGGVGGSSMTVRPMPTVSLCGGQRLYRVQSHLRRSRLCTTRVGGSSPYRHGGDGPARSGRAHTCQVQYHQGRRRTQLHSAYSIVETSDASPTSVDHHKHCARPPCLHTANFSEDILYRVTKRSHVRDDPQCRSNDAGKCRAVRSLGTYTNSSLDIS